MDFFDLGAIDHAATRRLLHRGLDGVLLVHDTAHSLTLSRLWTYLQELRTGLASDEGGDEMVVLVEEADRLWVPMLLVGTKIDLLSPSPTASQTTTSAIYFSNEFNCESVNLVLVFKYLAALTNMSRRSVYQSSPRNGH